MTAAQCRSPVSGNSLAARSLTPSIIRKVRLMRRNKAAWIIIGVFVLVLVLAIFLTPRGRDMNAAPGTLADQPEPAATAAP